MKLFFLEKLNEMDEFIKSRNVYKMQIAKMDDAENDDAGESDEEIKMKKISINTANTNFSD